MFACLRKSQSQSVMLYNRPKKVNRSNAKNTDTLLKGIGASRFSFARCRLHYRVWNLSLSHFDGKHGRHLLPSLVGDRRHLHDTNGTLLRRERRQNSKGRWTILVRASGTRKHNRLPSRLVILDRILAYDIDRDESSLAILLILPASHLLQRIVKTTHCNRDSHHSNNHQLPWC